MPVENDNRQIQRNAQGGSGTGGVIGSLGASIGDIGIGGASTATSGDINAVKNIDFAGPVYNKGLTTTQYLIIAAALVGAFYVWRKF